MSKGMDWHKYFNHLSMAVAAKSKDRSTKVGCVLVDDQNGLLVTGFNGMPRGVDDDVEARHERPEKYLWVCHAEQNAVAQAAKQGSSLRGATAYVTHHPCNACMATLIQAGVARVFYDGKNTTSMPEHIFEVARVMALEAGVELTALTNT